LEDVRRRIRLAPRLGEIALDGEEAGRHAGAGLVTNEPAVREGEDDLSLVREPADGMQVEVRRIPGANRDRSAPLRRVGVRPHRPLHEEDTSTRPSSFLVVTFLLVAAARAGPQQAPPPPPAYGTPISLEQAKKVMAGAEAEAKKNSWNVAIVIHDSGGNLVMM